MKRLLLIIVIFLLSLGINQAQTVSSHMRFQNEGETSDASISTPQTINPETDVMSAWVLPIAGGGSANARIPRNNVSRYQRTEYLITPAEMAASGYPVGYAVDALSFSIGTAGVGTQTGALTIYLKNTTDITYTLGSTWTTAGFTTVHVNPTFTVPYAAGNYTITFAGGSPFIYSGGGVYVAWEFSNPAGALPTGSTALVANCNTLQGTMCYGYQGATSGTALTVTAYRPATQFINNTLVDVLQVSNIYSQEKCPVPYGTPTNLKARVVNLSASSETFNVTMTITDQATSTVRYTNVQPVTLAGGTAQVVNFPAWTPAILENVNINVTIPTGTGETFTNNNTLTIPTNINNNLFGFCYTLNASSGYGFTYNGAGGIFANKFHMNGSGTIPSANLFIYNTSVNTGNTIYAVVLNSAGTIVAQSANLVIAAGDLGTNKNFTFPTPPTFTNEDFYVGMAQPTGGTVAWYPMGTMPEAPYRTNAYYTFAITGGTPSPRTTDVKLMIEAEVAAAQLTAHDVGTQSIDMNRVVALGTITPMATVKNYGANTETFQVNMTISGGYSSTQTVTGLVTGATVQVSFAPWTNTLGDYTVSVCTMLGTDLNESNDCVLNQAVKVVNLNRQVYAYNAFAGAGTDPVGPTTFTLATPGTLNSIANQSTLGFINGGTWANGIWYGTAYSAAAPFNLIRIDPVTGDRTIIGDMGVGTNGISFNPANNTMYAVSATSLYTVNLTTGLATLVGANTGVQMINFAINNSGQAYAVDITNDVLGSVNLTTGIFTGIGPIGFNANYAQDMEFDRDNGDLFMAAYGSYGFLGWVDLTTGAVLKVGNFEGSGEITGLAIPYTSADPLAVTGTPTDVTGCYGNTNGTISTTVTGGTAPYTYLWSNLATTASLSGIGAGTYTVTVTDAALSTATASWTISQPADIIVAGTPVNAACPSSNDGSIDITATGGTAPYTYLWSNSETIEDLTGLAPGTYTVVVTDANNCPKSGSFTVGVNDPVCDNIRLTGNISTTVCYDAHTTITVAGGAYTFSVVSPGHVTMIAGVNILLEPGTHIANGAYLHGYISTTFCTVSDAPMVAAGTGSEQTDLTFAHPNFLLYPNPTSGNFTLVQKGDGQFGNVKVEIYSMRGERVISAHMAGEQRHEFITSELPTGLYFVKVVGENYTETIKLVKSR